MIIYGATKDEIPQPLTNEQMTNIKSQFHPSNTANVNIVPYHKYSTTEHVVGEWIDGKTLYEKTITGTIPNTSGDVSTGLTGVSFAFIHDSRINWNNGYNTPVSYFDTTTRFVSVALKNNVTALFFDVGTADVAGQTYYITLRYTKTS